MRNRRQRIKHFFDDKNKLFIATEGRGVLTYDIEKCKAEEYLRYYFDDMPGLKGNVVMSVLPDPSKKRVWLANHPYGVLCYNFDFPTYRHFSHEKGNANTIGAGVVTAITEDSEGDIWFATSSGVSCYFKKIKKWKHYLTDENRKNLTYLAVCEIRPGIIATDMTSKVKEKYDNLIGGGLLPISRWGEPEDIADAVYALCSGALPYVTGQSLDVDGGFHLRRL